MTLSPFSSNIMRSNPLKGRLSFGAMMGGTSSGVLLAPMLMTESSLSTFAHFGGSR